MDRLKPASVDLTEGHVRAIADLIPSVMTEALDNNGETMLAIDFDLLRQELSGHVVEGSRERYQLDWPGKRAAVLAANAPTRATLRPLPHMSVEFDTTKNIFIEGDNLEVLKLLQDAYLGKIKVIYIDPPYNTGRDFIYSDSFAESTAEYLERSGQADDLGVRLVANTESNGRFHSDWLNMIYPRLRLARNLLSDDGVIFISIDDNELDNLLKVGREVFGEGNHVATLIWKSKSGGANDSGEVAVDHEYVVAFRRSPNAGVLGLDPDAEVTTSYNNQDEHGRYSLERLDKQNLQYSASMDYDLVGPDGTVYKLTHRNPSRPNAIWRWSKERVQKNMDQLVFKDGNVYTKNYEKPGGKPRSLLVDERFGRTRTGSTEVRDLLGGDYFDNPKPTKLLQMLVNIGGSRDGIVLDFFAGSGSTAHAVMALNAKDGGSRRFIVVQLPEAISGVPAAVEAGFETIADVARKRIEVAGTGIRSDLSGQGVDVGFRSLRLDSSNFVDVLLTPDNTSQEALTGLDDNIKDGRSGEDLLFQVMLSWGLDLALPIRVESLEGCEVFNLDHGALLACFAPGVSLDLVRQLAERRPLRMVFRDSGFTSDAERINAQQIFRELSPETEVRSL